MLLDGWDEVPSGQRGEIREAIQFESPHFVVVVTSRASGSPWQLFPSDRADRYEIAGLTPPAIRSFVEKQLRVWGEADRTEDIVRKIERDPDLWGMSANPFLLGLVVRVMSLGLSVDQTLTRHQLFQEISNWIVEHHQRVVPVSDQLLGEDLQALERLSYHLMFDQDSPQYVFRRQQLDDTLMHRRLDPLIQSRFINRLDPLSDNWSFLHATFEEYFSAKHLSSFDEQKLNVVWDRALCSQSRLVTLSFFAGQRGPKTAISKDRAEYWIKNLDRFGLMLAHLAQVAGAGHWRDCFQELSKQIEDQLWVWITTADEWRCSRKLLEAFATINPSELIRRAGSTRKIDLRILETICELLPSEFIRDRELFDVLPASLRDTVNLRDKEPRSGDEIDHLFSQINDPSLPLGEFLAVLRKASVVVDPSQASELLDRLLNEPESNLRIQMTVCLSPVFSRLPMIKTLELLTRSHPLDSNVRRMASTALAHCEGGGQRLDPDGRDIILRRLAVLPPGDARIHHLLEALQGFPIRDGEMLIAQIAMNRSLDTSIRNVAIEVMLTASDLLSVQLVVSSILTDLSDSARPFIFQLALQRDVTAPPEWLESQIAEETNSLRRRTLVNVYVRMFANAAYEESHRYREFLTYLIQHALDEKTPDCDLVAFEMASTVEKFCRTSEVFVSDVFLELGISLLQKIVARTGTVSVGQTRLAAALLRTNRDPRAVRILEQAMNLLTRQLGGARDNRTRNELDGQVMAIGEVLADIGVAHLLTYAPDCQPVKVVLCHVALKLGWLVFDDRILDANGNELANLKQLPPAEGTLDEVSIHALLARLNSETLKSAIQSRWIAVSVCRVCDASATDKEIHAAIDRIREGHEGDAAAEAMHTLYPTCIPKLPAWRQAVIRAVRKLKLLPGGLEYLRMQGLPKQG